MPGTNWIGIAHYAMRARPDYSASITHWTRKTGNRTAFEVLKQIVEDRTIRGSTKETGFIKGDKTAVCFTETPVTVMARTFLMAAHDEEVKKHVKWGPYGLSFLKPTLYKGFGGRPVLYLSDEECDFLCPPGSKQAADTLWRVVRFDQANYQEAIDFSHEREWRVLGDVDFSKLKGVERPVAIVSSDAEAAELEAMYPTGPDSPIRGVFSLFDLRVLG